MSQGVLLEAFRSVLEAQFEVIPSLVTARQCDGKAKFMHHGVGFKYFGGSCGCGLTLWYLSKY